MVSAGTENLETFMRSVGVEQNLMHRLGTLTEGNSSKVGAVRRRLREQHGGANRSHGWSPTCHVCYGKHMRPGFECSVNWCTHGSEGFPCNMDNVSHNPTFDHKTGAWLLDEKSTYFLDRGLADGLSAFFGRQTSVIELGAGMGCYSTSLLASGVKVHPFDGAPNVAEVTHGLVTTHDLSQPLKRAPADWVLCLEVAEHIPQRYEEAFLTNLDALNCKGLVISWASERYGAPLHGVDCGGRIDLSLPGRVHAPCVALVLICTVCATTVQATVTSTRAPMIGSCGASARWGTGTTATPRKRCGDRSLTSSGIGGRC